MQTPSPRPVRLPILLGLALSLAACSSIQVDEEDVFQPKPSVYPDQFEMEGVTLESVFFPAAGDSVELNAWLLTQPEARGTVLFFGGNGFYLVQSRGYIEALTGFPVDVMMMDYRGYGKSGGTPTVGALQADAVAAYAFLTGERGVDPRRLIVHGHSLGTFLALGVAEGRPVAGAVLENPITTVEAWADGLIPWALDLFLSLDLDESLKAESNVERVQTLQKPLLILAGAEDVIADPEMARTLHEEAAPENKRLVVIEGRRAQRPLPQRGVRGSLPRVRRRGLARGGGGGGYEGGKVRG